MARYVDGFVIAVPKKKLSAYRKMAALGAKVWKAHGALEYYECVGDDLEAQYGMMPFPKLARIRKGETVVFSWIVFKSRAHRDRVNAKVMKDKRMDAMMGKDSMPFDLKRMVYGGFEVMVDA